MNAIDLAKGEKKHRVSKSGVKARKKDEKNKKKRGLSTDRHNPKAFSVANIVRTKRTLQRNLDRKQQKEVVPLVNRAEELPPPALVVVMGPPGCGKSTLIRSLVKIFTNQNITDVQGRGLFSRFFFRRFLMFDSLCIFTVGPITVVAGKKKRITFFECPHDLHAMTDLAKVADLVLLMIDGSYGFEMETFEYLNLLQLHGFPKIIGVLSHLDRFKLNKTLQKTKKKLKHRFWTEIYKGAKMFDFTGVINGKYLKHEVKRLTLHISRVKFRPLVWRNTHPYVLVDRIEDITPASTVQKDPLCDRDVVLFGYVRGTHLKSSMRIHLLGVGDFDIESSGVLPDPCPIVGASPGDKGGQGSGLKLNKDALLYAPMANVGRVRMDKDGTYIDLHTVHYTKPENLDLADRSKVNSHIDDVIDSDTPAALLRSMQDVGSSVNDKLNNLELSLFAGSRGVRSADVNEVHENEDSDSAESDDDELSMGDSTAVESDAEASDSANEYYDSGISGDSFEQSSTSNLTADAISSYYDRKNSALNENLMHIVYGVDWANGGPPPGDVHTGTLTKKTSLSHQNTSSGSLWDDNEIDDVSVQPINETFDSSRLVLSSDSTTLVNIEELVGGGLKNKFVTGDWAKANRLESTTTGY